VSRVVITGDEWYPVWEVSDDDDPGGLTYIVQADPGQIRRWKRVMAEFKEVQDELESLTR
jgi:hypothetical protein